MVAIHSQCASDLDMYRFPNVVPNNHFVNVFKPQPGLQEIQLKSNSQPLNKMHSHTASQHSSYFYTRHRFANSPVVKQTIEFLEL
jgi:hypothetical protein